MTRGTEGELWDRIRTHPFVRAAADGTLAEATFERWLVEDHHFVVGFRRFLGRLLDMAPHEQARDVLAEAFGPLQDELDLFRGEAARRGLNLTAEPAPTTLGYTSFMLATASDGWPAAVTALYGIEKAYFDAWSEVRRTAEQSSPYWSFIDNWSSPAFGAWVDAVGELVAEVGRCERTFDLVVRFELRMWDAVHRGERWDE